MKVKLRTLGDTSLETLENESARFITAGCWVEMPFKVKYFSGED